MLRSCATKSVIVIISMINYEYYLFIYWRIIILSSLDVAIMANLKLLEDATKADKADETWGVESTPDHGHIPPALKRSFLREFSAELSVVLYILHLGATQTEVLMPDVMAT